MKTAPQPPQGRDHNRKLAHDHKALRRSRPYEDYGEYYILDTYRNSPIQYRMDLVDLARELKVMGEWEELAPAEESNQ